jgi:hypothetical protein
MILRSLPLSALLWLTGCFSTHLVNDEPINELVQLVESAQHQLSLTVTNPLAESSHGHQFMLGLLPVTRVFPDAARDIVVAKLQLHAGQAGLGLPENARAPIDRPHLEVAIRAISTDGYDLIVVRRPSASIKLYGTAYLPDQTTRVCEASGEHSEIKRFAFAADLTQVLSVAADMAAKRLLECLGVIDSQSIAE